MMDGQDYSTPLAVSRACFDEIRARMRADGRLTGDRETALEMRGVALVVEDVASLVFVPGPYDPISKRSDVRLSPVPEPVLAAPPGSTFTVEHAGWRYNGTPVRIVDGTAVFDVSAAWRRERLDSRNTRTR